jgi:hypothetical protein
MRRLPFVLALTAGLSVAAVFAQDRPPALPTPSAPSVTPVPPAPSAPPAVPAPQSLPGSPAPAQTVAEIRQIVEEALAKFQAMDERGLLAMVSPQYRTDTLTKAGIADQLRTVFTLHDQVRARVRIDDIRMVGEHAWVYSTGHVTGRLRVVGTWIVVGAWQRELEIARREEGRWRLYGYQQ